MDFIQRAIETPRRFLKLIVRYKTESTDMNVVKRFNRPFSDCCSSRSTHPLADSLGTSRVGYDSTARSRATISLDTKVFAFFSVVYLLALDTQPTAWRGRYYYRIPGRKSATRFRPRVRPSTRREARSPRLTWVSYQRNRRVQPADGVESGTRGDPTSSDTGSVVSGFRSCLILRRAHTNATWLRGPRLKHFNTLNLFNSGVAIRVYLLYIIIIVIVELE